MNFGLIDYYCEGVGEFFGDVSALRERRKKGPLSYLKGHPNFLILD